MLFSACVGTAQDTLRQETVSTGSLPVIVYSDGKEFIKRSLHNVQKALHPDGTTLVKGGIIAGATVSLFLFDQSGRTFAAQNHSSLDDEILNSAEKYGATGNALLLSGSVYAAGIVFESSGTRKTGSLLFESLMWTGVATSVIKCLFGRSRPFMNAGNTRFRGFQINNDYLSFPSGHSAAAFALSSVLSERIHNTAASIGLYSLAGMTAAARVYHDLHWCSDVFLGAMIGTGIGIAVVRSDEKEPNCSPAHIYIIPTGFQFVLEF